MQVYSVMMPGGIKDAEFDAYVRLLIDWGVDLSNMPRVMEKGTPNRWLHAWGERKEAERFAEQLRKRTKKKDWRVQAFQTEQIHEGPLGPVVINMGSQRDGNTYELDPFSRELIAKKYPQARIVPSVFIGSRNQRTFDETQAESIWDHVALILTGLSQQDLDAIGGYRIYDPIEKKVLREAPCFA